ncbi:MAG: GWxTD domain-containing protein [Bacteroidales bacterium]|nr:GWxTD domain-containing protein [Bacteroidales bacterium]
MKIQALWFWVTLLLAGVISCQTSRKMAGLDVSGFYSEKAFTHPRSKVFHINDSVSELYLGINTEDFLRAVSRATGDTVVRFRVSYELYNPGESKIIADSASRIYNDVKQNPGASEMILRFELKTGRPENNLLRISLTDLDRNENHTVYKYCRIDRAGKKSRQYFLVTDEYGLPFFDDYFGSDLPFFIHYSIPGEKMLVVRYFSREHPIARPPFALEKDKLFRFAPDSLFTLPLDNDGNTGKLVLKKEGIYHFQADTSFKEGLTLMRFHDGYPEIGTPDQALYSIRYLTTRPEYESMLKYADRKTAIDSFWLERARQDPGRAKSMIKKYYSRVEFSNHFFGTHKEGWKTDRGIIYIVYGPPTRAYVRTNEEEWIYGEEGNPLSIRFFFYRTNSPFTDNDFRLERSPAYKQNWYLAVENWRRE